MTPLDDLYLYYTPIRSNPVSHRISSKPHSKGNRYLSVLRALSRIPSELCSGVCSSLLPIVLVMSKSRVTVGHVDG